MADTVLPTGSSAQPAPHNGGLMMPLKWLLRVGLVVVVVYAVVVAYQLLDAVRSRDNNAASGVAGTGLIDRVDKGLASEFTDSKGRLLADPPTDPAQLRDPQTIVLAHIDSLAKDPESPEISWPAFEASLTAAIGRPVTDMTFDNSPEQLATIKTGAITLLALHAADVPYVVNNFGFQPVAVLGNDGGANGNHLDIIVPADSPITSPAMLAGHTLTCTVPSSITGYRAAIALLAQMNNLRPNADYLINWSLKQKLSIQGIVDKKYEAAAVSDDSLQTELRNGTLQANSYKNIFASDVIPRTTIGYFYDLKPDLAAKVQAAIKAYAYHDPNDTLSKDLKFLPVDYKTDFKLVREIDDRFDPRFDSKPKKATDTPTDTPAPDATATPPATTPATPPPK